MNAVWGYVALAAFGVLAAFAEWWERRQAQTTGAALASASANATAVKAQAAMTQAAVQAPVTRLAVVDRLKAGTF
ncbi:MAG TPA: hypothetical protein VMU59_09250 [Caulobacteraceae bacterium]|nr:hypothetical protein [Caulobacteraceae bacterium]